MVVALQVAWIRSRRVTSNRFFKLIVERLCPVEAPSVFTDDIHRKPRQLVR